MRSPEIVACATISSPVTQAAARSADRQIVASPACLVPLPDCLASLEARRGFISYRVNLVGAHVRKDGCGNTTWPTTECISLSEMEFSDFCCNNDESKVDSVRISAQYTARRIRDRFRIRDTKVNAETRLGRRVPTRRSRRATTRVAHAAVACRVGRVCARRAVAARPSPGRALRVRPRHASQDARVSSRTEVHLILREKRPRLRTTRRCIRTRAR